MKYYSLEISDAVSAALESIWQQELADDQGNPSALTGDELLASVIRTQYESKLFAKYRRERVNTATEEQARKDKETALANEEASRKAAEDQQRSNAETDMATVKKDSRVARVARV